MANIRLLPRARMAEEETLLGNPPDGNLGDARCNARLRRLASYLERHLLRAADRPLLAGYRAELPQEMKRQQ